MKKMIVDRAADFVLAVERVFGEFPRVLDGSRAVLIGDVKLSLEAGEKELCLIRMHGALEEWLAVFEIRGDMRALPFASWFRMPFDCSNVSVFCCLGRP